MHRKGYPPDWELIAANIKQKANWKCSRCHKEHSKERGAILTVHHIDGDPTNNEPSNLIALCQVCHLKEQAKLKPYLQKALQEKLGQLAIHSL